MESGYTIAGAILEQEGDLEKIYSDYQEGTKALKNYMERQWNFVGGISETFCEMKQWKINIT